jgi:hypothetical protein
MMERRMIVAGSVLGALSGYLGASDLVGRAPALDFSDFLAPIAILKPLAAAVQIVLTIASVAYVVRNRLSPGYAITLLLSVNFFLPFYLTVASLPNVFGYAAFGHGLQYILFLLYHAAGYRRPGWRGLVMVAAFLGAVAITAELWYFQNFRVPYINGIVVGVLLAHFWFDSIIWRMKDPEAGRWVKRRYSFLFGT